MAKKTKEQDVLLGQYLFFHLSVDIAVLYFFLFMGLFLAA